jgi:ABC-type transport system involved in Fe-S cluster assembly fused permease/ATPase subunit
MVANGGIAEVGSHLELMQPGETYAEPYALHESAFR